MMMVSPSETSPVILSRPTTAGISKARARMEEWEVLPPRSVKTPITLLLSICRMSAGERSWATTITFPSIFDSGSCFCPTMCRSTRSTTVSTSEPRSRR